MSYPNEYLRDFVPVFGQILKEKRLILPVEIIMIIITNIVQNRQI